MIKAIIFDCFGVLATDGWLPFKRKHFGNDEKLFEKAGELNKRVDAGLADYGDFIHEIATMAHMPDNEAREAIEDNPPHEELFEYIAGELKPRYKIGMLSNVAVDWLNKLFTPEQVALFDAVALSYETGFVKPDARAYEIIAERLGVAPEESIFIDDQERFCAAAKDAGMHEIHFQNFAQMKHDLENIITS